MYLGIDLGTSAVKICVMHPEGNVAAVSSNPLSVTHPFEGASEQTCADWWQATCAAVQHLDPKIRTSIKAIGLSGQMHGAVVLDAAGQDIRPVILWNDARATTECADMMAAHDQIGDITGVLPMPGFTAPKLLWLARHEPAHHAQIAHVLLPKDYIGYRMHGRFVTDPCDAAGTSWLDERTRQWSDQICALSATDPAWLPDIASGTEIVGALRSKAAIELGLPSGIPIAAGAGDAAAGAVGIGAVRAGDGFISLGTSGQLFVTTDTYRPNPQSRIHAYAHTLPEHWFQMAAMLNGARPMAWLADLLNRPIDALLADAAKAEARPLFLPYLTGERTPHGDSEIRGGFAGLSETTTPGALMRAVVDAVAFTFADATVALQAAGTVVDRLLAIGGGTRSDLLMQTIADITGCTLGRSDAADVGPALGAARLAYAATHKDAPPDIFTKPQVETWFAPNPEQAAQLTQCLAAYRALYPALKAVQAAGL